MFRVFKITDAGGKTSSPDLLGLLFIQTNEGLFLVDPESEYINRPPRIMASAVLKPTNPPLAEFKFRLKELDWKVIVDQHHSSSELHGSWHNNRQAGAEDDHWVATGTGTGTDTDVPDDDEARAASTTN